MPDIYFSTNGVDFSFDNIPADIREKIERSTKNTQPSEPLRYIWVLVYDDGSIVGASENAEDLMNTAILAHETLHTQETDFQPLAFAYDVASNEYTSYKCSVRKIPLFYPSST